MRDGCAAVNSLGRSRNMAANKTKTKAKSATVVQAKAPKKSKAGKPSMSVSVTTVPGETVVHETAAHEMEAAAEVSRMNDALAATAARRIAIGNMILDTLRAKLDELESKGASREDITCATYAAFLHGLVDCAAGTDEEAVVDDLRAVLRDAKDATAETA